MGKKGYLILESGQIFTGISFGFESETSGEVVFNTGMVGYPEGFSDPSYYGQILTLTYPLIGNYGVPKKTFSDGLINHFESERIHIRGLVVSSYMDNKNHYQAEFTLGEWLKNEKVPAISGIDTRSLTKILRERGVMKGIITFASPKQTSGFKFYDVNKDNLVDKVSCKKPFIYGKGKIKIALLDCGVKVNQIRLLLKFDTTIMRLPWDYNLLGAKSSDFDALFVSNGPGDPKMADKTIATVKIALQKKIPTLGVCLGNQILALAAGANTYKLKYGHRGQNQPVKDEFSRKCYITTQNHGFAVDTKTLPSGWLPWFTNLNDGTNEGIRHVRLPFFSSQFHPESMPGPTDTEWIFAYFIEEIKKWKRLK